MMTAVPLRVTPMNIPDLGSAIELQICRTGRPTRRRRSAGTSYLFNSKEPVG
jgi:hypothetical protein